MFRYLHNEYAEYYYVMRLERFIFKLYFYTSDKRQTYVGNSTSFENQKYKLSCLVCNSYELT